MSSYTNEEVGFGDVQTDETPTSKVKGAVVPSVHPTPLPKPMNPVLPAMPPLPAAKPQNATDILPPLPATPSIVENPVNQENAKTVGEYGAGTAAIAALIGAGLPYLYSKFAGNKTPPPSGSELTINPATLESTVPTAASATEVAPSVASTQTIKSRSFSPAEQYVAENINNKYPFTFDEAKKGLGLEGVKITSPQEATIVANQYAKKLEAQTKTTLAPEFVPQAAETTKSIPTAETQVSSTEKPVEVARQPAQPPEGMREQYSRGKKNPIGPSAFNHLANNLGLEKATEVWEATYGKKNVPYEQYMAEYSKAAGKDMPGPRQPLAEGQKPGGSFGKPQYIPEYIKGGATLGGLGAAAGGSLAALGAMQAIQKGRETGDWTDLGQLGLDTVAGAINPALLFATHMGSTNEGEAEALSKERYKQMVGGGRGIAPPSPRQQVGRR